MKLLRTSKAAAVMGISPMTLRRMCDEGFPHTWTKGKRPERRFDEADCLDWTGRGESEEIIEAHYIRVSGSSGQETSLASQGQVLLDAQEGELFKLYQDRASGLNENRAGLRRMIADAKAGHFNVVRVVYRDRLTRFGFDYLVQLLDELGVTVIVEDDEELPMQEELMRDFMSLIASFSGKYYKLRAVESKKKMLADLKAMI